MATAIKERRAARQVNRGEGVASDSAPVVLVDDYRWTTVDRSRPAGGPPVDFVARRDAALARDGSAAERWLDEGGSFSNEGAS